MKRMCIKTHARLTCNVAAEIVTRLPLIGVQGVFDFVKRINTEVLTTYHTSFSCVQNECGQKE